jgi:uncharacterized UBP type Zn finger protein
MNKAGDKTVLENMIDNLFSLQIRQDHCKKCKKETKLECKRSLVVLPKVLIVVVDRRTFRGELRNLIDSFPENIDLREHLIKQDQESSVP